MNKYEAQLEELKEEWEKKHQDYISKITPLKQMETQFCNMTNSQITIINVERHLMRKEIRVLHKFLKQFGEIGEKLTPFDFVAEDWLFPGSSYSSHVERKGGNPLDFSSKKAMDHVAGAAVLGSAATVAGFGASSLAGTASIVAGFASAGVAIPLFVPAALPAYMFYSAFKEKSASKESLIKYEKKCQNEYLAWKNEIERIKDSLEFYRSAVQISDMYRVLIAEIRDTIEEKIIPELNGVLAFLYADAIKNCIINNEDPGNVRLGNIAEYRGTPYERHYWFVKNTFDYYSLICTFFSEPVLTNLLKGNKISNADMDRFEKKLKRIGEQQLELYSLR